jgi:alanine dehydrogenase
MTAPPTLLLSRALISKLATPKEYIDAIRTAFADLAEGHLHLPSVAHVSGIGGTFHIKAAGRVAAPAFAAVKVNGNFPNNGDQYRLPTIQGFIALFDAECGNLLALMDSIEITARRTAAATALAAQYLADPNAHTVGIVGCGVQARYHIEALAQIVAIETVLYCDLDDRAADSFELHLQKTGLRARRVPDAKAACQGADIVVTLTPSTRPILELADIAPGTFVAGVGADNPAKHELTPDLLRNSRVVVDSLAQASVLGDLHHAIVSGEMAANEVYGELGDLVVGRVAARRGRGERWIFDSTGLAVQDLAAAEMLYALARTNQHVPRMHFND